MAEPTQREIDLARELDREIVEEETGEADIDEMAERVTALIARKLAAYRLELLQPAAAREAYPMLALAGGRVVHLVDVGDGVAPQLAEEDRHG